MTAITTRSNRETARWLWSNSIFSAAQWRPAPIQMMIAMLMVAFWIWMGVSDLSAMAGGPFDPAIPSTEWFHHAIQWEPEYSYLDSWGTDAGLRLGVSSG